MSAVALGKAENRVLGLDIMRVFAITLVWWVHMSDYLPKFFTHLIWRGIHGVEVFFVLSAWLIARPLFRSYRGGEAVDTAQFRVMRLGKTIPPYLAVLVVLVMFGVVRFSDVPYYLTFTQNYANAPWGVTWSLCVEEWFYLWLPTVTYVFLKFGPRVRLVLFLGMFFFSLACRLYVWSNHGSTIWLPTVDTDSHYRFDGIMFGVLVAAIYEWYPTVWGKIVQHKNLLFVFGVLLFWAFVWFKSMVYVVEEATSFSVVVLSYWMTSLGAACTLPLLSTFNPRWTSVRWVIETVAKHTYCVYLTHSYAIHLVRGRISPQFGGVAEAAAALVLTAVFGSLLYRFVEVPATRRRHDLLAFVRQMRVRFRSLMIGRTDELVRRGD